MLRSSQSAIASMEEDPERVQKYGTKHGKVHGHISDSTSMFNVVMLGMFPQHDDMDKEDLVQSVVSKAENIRNGTASRLIILSEALRLVDISTGEVFLQIPLESLTYTMQAGRRGNLVAFIAKNEMVGLKMCYLCRVDGGGSKKVLDILAVIQENCRKAAALALSNPFKPISETEVVPNELSKLEIDRETLKAEKVIGAGQYGRVYSAELGDSAVTTQSVAVKMLNASASGTEMDAFIAECCALQSFQHKNISKILGVSFSHHPWLLVIEFLPYGDLKSVLVRCREKSLVLSSAEQLGFTVQILTAMEYIASLKWIHMDLAARNVLVGPRNFVQVADFGLARYVGDSGVCMLPENAGKLPMKWLSIEAMDFRKFSQASDVWAFGVTWWEQFSYGEEPYIRLKSKAVQQAVREGLRLQQPSGCPSDVFELMKSCWLMNRRHRPTFADLLVSVRAKFTEMTAPNDNVRDVALEVIDKVKKNVSVQDMEYGFGDLLDRNDSGKRGTCSPEPDTASVTESANGFEVEDPAGDGFEVEDPAGDGYIEVAPGTTPDGYIEVVPDNTDDSSTRTSSETSSLETSSLLKYFGKFASNSTDTELQKMLRSSRATNNFNSLCRVPSFDIYNRYSESFEEMLRNHHDVARDRFHGAIDLSLSENQKEILAKPTVGILSFKIRIELKRNVLGFPPTSSMTSTQRSELEAVLRAACEDLDGEGTYYSFTEGHECEVVPAVAKSLVTAGHMFSKPENPAENPGIASDWPNGRACFIFPDKTKSVQIGGHDHLKLIYRDQIATLEELPQLVEAVLAGLERSKIGFRQSSRFGYITSDPADIGTGLHLFVAMKVPNEVIPEASRRCNALHLRLSVEESSSNCSNCTVSNISTFGITEVEIILTVHEGVVAVLKAVSDADKGKLLDSTVTHETSESLVSVSESDIGKRVMVDGYRVPGYLRFFGPHHIKKGMRCGIEFDEPIGRNNGNVGGHEYFSCPPSCGVLVVPRKVALWSNGLSAAYAEAKSKAVDTSLDKWERKGTRPTDMRGRKRDTCTVS